MAYVCSSCSAQSARELGQCPQCKSWNTLVEKLEAPKPTGRARARADVLGGSGRSATLTRLGSVSTADRMRVPTGIGEFDRATGGGLVTGSLVLVAGEPGAGKTTLLSQVVASLVGAGHRAIYVSGEESAGQIRLRSERLGLPLGELEVLCTTDIADVVATIAAERPAFAVIDSIQTMVSPTSDGVAGAPAQVREVTGLLLRTAKETGTTLLLVGHVNKDAAVAGPKTLEHLVDAVFTIEGDRHGSLRVLRATKNRFGATDEIGLFEMRETGMIGIDAPAPLRAEGGVPFGRTIAPVLEGNRPLLVEVQALVAKAAYSSGRRVAIGVAEKRVAMLLAVLERYAGIDLSEHDVYVTTGAGITVSETAIDAAICAAVASSYWSVPVPDTAVVVGEVSLGGGLRAVRSMPSRLKEATRLGFTRGVGPRMDGTVSGFAYAGAEGISDLLGRLGVLHPKGAAPVASRTPAFALKKRGADAEEAA
jgi:DNA repair protein RadA/Sms